MIFCLKLLYIIPKIMPELFLKCNIFSTRIITEITITCVIYSNLITFPNVHSLYLFLTKPGSLHRLSFVGDLLTKSLTYTVTFTPIKHILFYSLAW
jgi:hypothetical protein